MALRGAFLPLELSHYCLSGLFFFGLMFASSLQIEEGDTHQETLGELRY